ncbi:MAG: hypothetical protein JWO85_652 [Candidatus Eremiobacteraeota bacterium]|nr:hypothetical protein [Candidatus Eremiobacteraeota bacterium]
MTPAKIGPILLEALRRFWIAVLVFFAAGIVLGVASYTRNVPAFVSYRATALLGIAPVAAPGVTPPCTASGIPTLARSPDAIGVNPPRTSHVTASVETPTLVDVIATSGNLVQASHDANDAATNLAIYCNARIDSAFSAQVAALDRQAADQQHVLAGLDTKTIAASTTAADTTAIRKQLDDLQTKHDTLEDKWAAQMVVAASASAGLVSLQPVAYDEVRAANTRYAALQKQYNADAALYDLIASQYRPTAPRVIDLGARVATDRAMLESLRVRLDVPSNLMLSATYAKAYAAAQTAGSDAAQLRAQVDLYDQRIAKLKATLPSGVDQTAVRAAQRESTVAEKTYATLATQAASVRAEKARLAASPAVTVAGASTSDTVVTLGTRTAALFALGVVLAFLLLGIIVAVIALLLDDRLITTAQITKLYAKPVIATLQPKGKA